MNDAITINCVLGEDEGSMELIRKINNIQKYSKYLPDEWDFMETCEFIFEMGLVWCEENESLEDYVMAYEYKN